MKWEARRRVKWGLLEGGEGHTILYYVDMQMRKTFLCLPSFLLQKHLNVNVISTLSFTNFSFLNWIFLIFEVFNLINSSSIFDYWLLFDERDFFLMSQNSIAFFLPIVMMESGRRKKSIKIKSNWNKAEASFPLSFLSIDIHKYFFLLSLSHQNDSTNGLLRKIKLLQWFVRGYESKN